MIILHNSQDQASRDFVATNGEGHTVIDWYSDQRATYTGPTPSAFPSVVDMDAAGGPVIIRMPVDIADAEAQIAAIVAARDPAATPRSWTPLEFIERFTGAEQLAIVTAAQSNAALRLFYDKLMASLRIEADEPRLVAGMQALVDADLISAERRNEILEA